MFILYYSLCRGDARSYSEDKILEQVTTLASNGFGSLF